MIHNMAKQLKNWGGQCVFVLAGFAAMAGATPAIAQHDHAGNSILLFPHAIYANRSGDLRPQTPDNIDAIGREVAVSLFVSAERENFRFLTEILLSNFEKDIERFQLGYAFDARNTLWLGRFHNPAGIWNIEHHHGSYLQTSISRPHIVSYEDGGGGLPIGEGVVPMHLTGLLLEGSRGLGAGAVNYEIGFARGPALGDALEPFPILQTSVPGKETFTARLGYKPDETSATQAGVFTTRSNIPVTNPIGGDFNQSLFGFYAQLSGESTRLFGEWFDITNQGSLGGPVRSDKLNAWFLQGEYRIQEPLTAYARLERSTSNAGDPFLALFAQFPKSTNVLGLRWDFMANHAVTLEYSANTRRDDSQFNQLMLQWAAVFK
jgi:hypothetical protein